MSAAMPSGWKKPAPGEYRWEVEGPVVTVGARVVLNPKGFVEVAARAWSESGTLPMEPHEAIVVVDAQRELLAWLAGGGR